MLVHEPMKIIDIHTHGIGGHDTRTAAARDILRIAEIQASSGITAIIPTIYPDTIRVMRENMHAVKQAMDIQKAAARPMRSMGAPILRPSHGITSQGAEAKKTSHILGVHLEGPFLNPVKCGALNTGAFIEPSEHSLIELLDGLEDIVKIITIAPELDGATRIIKKMTDMGIISSMGHSDATYNEAENGFNSGARGITHMFNAMRSIHHREPGIAGFGLINNEIYIEVIADPHHLAPETLELVFRTKAPEKIIIVSDSVKGTKSIEQGTNQCVVDSTGKLQGGSMTIIESSLRLIELGFDEEIINNAITNNPEVYLTG